MREILVSHAGRNYYGKYATIESTHLGKEGHGILTTYLGVEGDGWGVSVGGYALDTYDKAQKRRVPTAYGLDFILRLCETVGVERWEDLKGRGVLVLYAERNSLWRSAVGIAHAQDEKRVFVFEEHVEEWKLAGGWPGVKE